MTRTVALAFAPVRGRGVRACGRRSPPSRARAWRRRSSARSSRCGAPVARAGRRRGPSGAGSRCSPPARSPRRAGCSAASPSRWSRRSLGPALVVGAVRARRRRYTRAVRKGAAGVARALADAVGAGHSIRGAIEVAAGGTAGAAGHELRATARALALGEPTADALEGLRRRAGDPAWDAIVAGILLQRDAGGDLAGLLRDQATALEAADRIGRDARTATAQARFTARLVLLLPARRRGPRRTCQSRPRRRPARPPAVGLARRHGRHPPARRDPRRRPAGARAMTAPLVRSAARRGR